MCIRDRRYEPSVDLATGRVVDLEVIPYWHSPVYGPVPLTDVEHASNTNFIESLAVWGFGAAGSHLSQWRAEYASYSCLEISSQVCGPMLNSAGLLSDLAGQLERHSLRAKAFTAQIDTEMLTTDTDSARATCNALKEAGFNIALSDFDGGIDMVATAKSLPIRTIRLSKEFTEKVGRMQVDASLSRSVIGLAKSMNLRVIATGVRTARQLTRLRSFGCDIAQGELFAGPLSAEEISPLLRQRAVFYQLVDSMNDLPGGF